MRHLNAAPVTHNPFKANTFIFTAGALPVLHRAEDALRKQPVFLRFERAVVDRLRLRDLTVAPATHLLRAGKTNLNSVKIVSFEHYSTPSKPDILIPNSGMTSFDVSSTN